MAVPSFPLLLITHYTEDGSLTSSIQLMLQTCIKVEVNQPS